MIIMIQIVNDNNIIIMSKLQTKCPALPPIFISQAIAEMVGIAYLCIILNGFLVYLFKYI